MSSRERVKHTAAIFQDMDEVRRAKLAQAPPEVDLAPMAKFEECAASSAPNNTKNSVSTPSQSVSSRGRSISVPSLYDEPVPSPIAAVSYDITAVPTLADPQDLLAEVKFIETLYKAAQARALVRRARAKVETARAIEEAQKIDDAAFGHTVKRNPLSQADGNIPGSSAAPDSGLNANINLICGTRRFWAVPGQHPPENLGTLGKWTSCFCCCSRLLSDGENVDEAGETDGPCGVTTGQPRAAARDILEARAHS